jgi:hypothetical protein
MHIPWILGVKTPEMRRPSSGEEDVDVDRKQDWLEVIISM